MALPVPVGLVSAAHLQVNLRRLDVPPSSCCLRLTVVFLVGCDNTVRLNNTYFIGTSDTVSSPCQLSVSRAVENVCQIRLDFDEFDIAGPVTTTASKTNTNCESALFTASSHGKSFGATICGNNRGHHMILEAGDSNNILGEISRIYSILFFHLIQFIFFCNLKVCSVFSKQHFRF